jgi:glucokinase
MIVVPGGRDCVCGGRGCVETESAGSALALHLAVHGLPLETRAESLLASDEPAARAVLRDWAGPLRVAIDTLSVTLAPEAVLVGGGLGAAMVAALARVPKETGDWFDPQVIPAALGDDAGVVGAAAAALAGAGAKRVVLVNGVPASGKSRVARALAAETGWPVLTLDTIKEPFLQALQPVDRPFNRKLGQSAYQAIFGLLADAPGGTFILDAWFGFQPAAVLTEGLERAGVGAVVEVWCAAPPEEIGRRYAARVAGRTPGHPGLDYVPELVELAARAQPEGTRPTLRVGTDGQVDAAAIADWAGRALGQV